MERISAQARACRRSAAQPLWHHPFGISRNPTGAKSGCVRQSPAQRRSKKQQRVTKPSARSAREWACSAVAQSNQTYNPFKPQQGKATKMWPTAAADSIYLILMNTDVEPEMISSMWTDHSPAADSRNNAELPGS